MHLHRAGSMNDFRHYLRLDAVTQQALEEICRHTFATKSELMRRYVREGVRREAQDYAEQVQKLRAAGALLASV
jgi:hypothetical protein